MNNCVEVINHSRVKVEEGKRKVVFLNPENLEYRRGRIDGCLVKEGIRADFFVSDSERSIIIELKGSNVAHACDQLFAAAVHAEVKPHLCGRLGFLIICSRYPAHDTSVQIAMSKARRKFGAVLRVFTDQRELQISTF